MDKKYKLKVYTKEIIERQYPNGLALSVHIGINEDGSCDPIHNDYGILFPKASIDEKNVIVPAFVCNLRVAKALDKSLYFITGEDANNDGSVSFDTEGKLWCWSTEDFISFNELGLQEMDRIAGLSGLIKEQLRENDEIEISCEMASKIKQHWNPISFKEMRDDIAFYSDGSSHLKNVKNYPRSRFPFARGFGDPVILLWENEYYFIATNDNLDDIGLYVRKAHEIDDLFKEDAEMYLILDKDEKRGLIQTFWAPEFHVINGDLYILFAVSNENWGPQCHMMKLKKGGDILKPEDWEDPVKVKRKGGRPLGENGITLDMTYVKSWERHYYVWSYREHIGTPLDSGSMLMVGEFSPEKPDELITEPVCISRPLYGFENTRGTINNEGPYAFYHNGIIYLSYSGGDARGYLYTIGMLTAEDGADLCDIDAWEKAKTPVLNFKSVPGELGPGHNSFFKDRNGDWWIAFHGVRFFEEKVISDGIRRIHFDLDDKPRFDLAYEEDFPVIYRGEN